MGLRTASARHPQAMVMAPALTKTTQSPNFKSLSQTTEPATPLTSRDEHNIYHSLEGDSCCDKPNVLFDNLGNDAATNSLATLALVSELLNNKVLSSAIGESSPNCLAEDNIMNSSPLHMDDHKDRMGLQKAGLDIMSSLIKDKTTTNSDMDHLFNNIDADSGSVASEMAQNVDDLMQVIKSIESAGEDRLGTTSSDLGAETDSIFPLSGTDLTTNLSSLEKELFNDVDVMSIDEQLIDGTITMKENHSKDLIMDLQKRHVTLERKLSFILRRLRKLQSKQMGQHVSEEIAGIYEHVHRTFRRTKDANNTTMPSQFELDRTVKTPTVELERLKPISQTSVKNLVRKLEMSSTLQANASARQRHVSRYFGSGSVETNSVRNSLIGATIIPQWTPECKSELQRVTGFLATETRVVQELFDSEATASSSGGESCDEMQAYNNPHQQYLAIQKRAAWRYATERATVAARWTWLQAQIADLEYRIRQYSDLHKQIRASKGALLLGGASPPRSLPTSPTTINGYRGQLPGSSLLSTKAFDTTANGAVNNSDSQVPNAARTRPLVNFRKRKLLQTWGLHAVSKKAARSATLRCGCIPPDLQCALCTGRTDPTRPRDLADYLSKSERIALLDPSFHPVFTLSEDTSASIHLEAIMKIPEWQHRSTRPNMKTVKYIPKGERPEKCNLSLEYQPKKQQIDHRRKYTRMIRPTTISALSAKIKNKFRGRKPGMHSLARLRRKRHSEKVAMAHLQSSTVDVSNDELEQIASNSAATGSRFDSRSSSPLLSMQTISSYKRNSRISSYDIDNIVIPYSVAASTRVEKLQYKEILTPKWRIVDPDFSMKYDCTNNGQVNDSEQDSDNEDFSEDAVMGRHDKCEHDEKKKFLSYLKFPYGYGRSRSHKRTDSRAESSGGNTPDPMSPHPGDIPDNAISPLTSPPATPLSIYGEETLPSISMIRKRTISHSRAKEKESLLREEVRCTTPESIEVVPYDKRLFPICDDTYDKMLKLMPENHQFTTNNRAQDFPSTSPVSYLEQRPDTPGSESTESAVGDEDPNDPEWIDMEGMKDRYRR